MFHLLLSRANTTACNDWNCPSKSIREPLRRAAELRKQMTPEEQIVWQELRGNRLGVHFRKQHPLAPFIVDFYCHQARLVMEIDGNPHLQQQGYDRLRDAYLARFGIRMLRLANHSVRGDPPSVIYAIRDACGTSPKPFPKGEGEQKAPLILSVSLPFRPGKGGTDEDIEPGNPKQDVENVETPGLLPSGRGWREAPGEVMRQYCAPERARSLTGINGVVLRRPRNSGE